MNLTDNIDKLPKWAQAEVRILKMRLNEAKKELERILENPKSNTILGSCYIMGGEGVKYLTNNQLITFVLPTGNIEAGIEGDCVNIHCNEGDLYVKPKVSNVVQIHLK